MQYQCDTCHYIYDEETEQEHFDKLSDDWECPMCGSPKDMFMVI